MSNTTARRGRCAGGVARGGKHLRLAGVSAAIALLAAAQMCLGSSPVSASGAAHRVGAVSPARGVESLPRLHRSSLVYQGALLLPQQVSDTKTFSYGGTALAYDPGPNGLFVVGHDWYQLTAEVSIPRPVDTTKLAALRRARFVQPFVDATGGAIDQAGPSTNKIGDQLVYNGRLYGTVYVYYDATDSQTVTHWFAPRPASPAARRAASTEWAVGAPGWSPASWPPFRPPGRTVWVVPC